MFQLFVIVFSENIDNKTFDVGYRRKEEFYGIDGLRILFTLISVLFFRCFQKHGKSLCKKLYIEYVYNLNLNFFCFDHLEIEMLSPKMSRFFSLMYNNIDMMAMKLFCCNPNITQDDITLLVNSEGFVWDDWIEYISRNPNLQFEFVKEHIIQKWNWYYVTRLPSVTIDIIREHPNYPWDIHGVRDNPSIRKINEL